MPRQRPEVISTRVLPHERSRIRALAELEGVSVSEALHRLLIPAVHERLGELAREPEEVSEEPDPREWPELVV